MRTPTMSPEEIGRLGDAIYERDIRSRVEDAHDGWFVAIDVDSERWALAADDLAAVEDLQDKQPDAINMRVVRVGYRAVGSIGGGSPR